MDMTNHDGPCRARASSPVPQVPDGWRLVPVDLTPEMEAVLTNERCVYASAGDLYRDLCAASPAPVAIASGPASGHGVSLGEHMGWAAPVASHEPASVSEEVTRLRAELAKDFRVVSSSAPPPEPAKAEAVDGYQAHFGYSHSNNCWWVRVHGCETEDEARALRSRILSAFATPPTAPAAARSAAEEMRPDQLQWRRSANMEIAIDKYGGKYYLYDYITNYQITYQRGWYSSHLGIFKSINEARQFAQLDHETGAQASIPGEEA